MNGPVLGKGALRVVLVVAGVMLAPVFLIAAPLASPLRAAGMLALPCLLLWLLRREDRRLNRAACDIRSGPLGPPFRHLLLGQRRKLDKALHR